MSQNSAALKIHSSRNQILWGGGRLSVSLLVFETCKMKATVQGGVCMPQAVLFCTEELVVQK